LVSALVVKPGIVNVPYEPGETVEFSIEVYPQITEDTVLNVEMASESAFPDNFEFEQRILVSPGQDYVAKFNLTIPDESYFTSFGYVTLGKVRITQVPYIQGGAIAATVSMKIPVKVDVPYPDKYLSIYVEDVFVDDSGESVELNAQLQQLGLYTLDEVTGYFEVTDGEDFSKTVDMGTINLMIPNVPEEVSVSISSHGMTAGRYDLYLHATYDGEEKSSNTADFVIAEKNVEIVDISPRELEAGIIDSLTLRVFNYWYEDYDTEIKLIVYDNERKIVTETDEMEYVLGAYLEKSVSMSLDLIDVAPGNYTLEATISYEDGEATKEFDVEVQQLELITVEEEYESITPTLILVIVFGSAILVAILVLIAIILLKDKKSSKKK